MTAKKGFGGVNKKVLELDKSGDCVTLWTKCHWAVTLKWLILCPVNFTSIFFNEVVIIIIIFGHAVWLAGS